MTKLSIAIDMGAKNNGVFIVKSNGNKIINKKASCIIVDGHKINFSKKSRRENRHKDRNYKRRKLAKRLLGELIDINLYSTKEQELINGLLNNRGYTFLSVSSEFEEIQDETLEFLKLYVNNLSILKTKKDFEQKFDKFDDEKELLVFLEKNIINISKTKGDFEKFLKKQEILKDIANLQKKDIKKFQSFSIFIKDLIYKNKIKYTYIDKEDKEQKKYLSLEKQEIIVKKIQENYDLISSIDLDEEMKKINNISFNEDSKNNEKIIQNDLKLLKEFLIGAQKEIETGAKPRNKYLKDIKSEIIQDFKFLKDFTEEDFFNLVGNISNLQLRVLRKFFNNNSSHKTKYEIIEKYFTAFHYKSDEEKELRVQLFQELDKHHDLKIFLKNTNPLLTIPPYEDMNNRDTYKCNSMLIKPELITDDIQKAIDTLLKKDEFKSLTTQLDRQTGEFINVGTKEIIFKKHKKLSKEELNKYNNKNNQAPIKYENINFTYSKYLQRILDIKLYDKKDDTSYNKEYHPRIVFKNENANAISLFKKLFTQDIFDTLKPIAQKYYEQEHMINSGIYEEKTSLFVKCNTNTPYKNNIKHTLLQSLYSYSFTEDEADVFLEALQDTRAHKGLQTSLKRISDEAKKYQNSFFHIVEACFNDDKCVDDKEIKSIVKNIDKTLQSFKSILNNKNTFLNKIDKVKNDNLKRVINIFKQTYEILFKDLGGFNKTCKYCTEENAIRSDEDNVIAKRLLSDVAKPIDGMLDMILDRLAYDITKDISKDDIEDIDKLEILLEQNKFNFEQDLNAIKKDSNNDIKKLKQEYKDKLNVDICPYTDDKITKGDYDHILPQSQGVFNSKANMIYASVKGNQEIKKDKNYTLEMITKKHLKAIFKTNNIAEIKKIISTNINTIKEDDFTNFDNLKLKEQIAFRYALFMRGTDEFNKAFKLLQRDKIKTFSNGTQKRLARFIYEKLVKKYHKQFQDIAVNSQIINNILVSNTRRILSHQEKELQKKDIQDSHSHCIDAMVVYHLANSKGSHINRFETKEIKDDKISKREFNFNFNDIYLEESNINNLSKSVTFINSNKKEIGSYKLFDETIYSEHYKHLTIDSKIKELEVLIKYNLLYQNSKNKKIYVQNIEDMKNKDIFQAKIFQIDIQKTSNLLHKLFNEKTKEELEKFKFLDGLRYSTSRQDIEKIFFNETQTKFVSFEAIKSIPPYSHNLYKAVYEKLDNANLFKIVNEKQILDTDKLNEILKGMFGSKQKDKNIQQAKRGKKRHTYTLPITGAPKFRIKRGDAWQVLGNNDIATKNYIIKGEIKPIPFFSKNTIPLNIEDLIDCLLINEDTLSIYEVDIDVSKFKEIEYLKYIVTEAKRCTVIATFNKQEFKDINFDNIDNFDCSKDNIFYNFVNKYIECETLFANYINSMRNNTMDKKNGGKDKKLKATATLVDNNKETITLQYKANINNHKKKIILANLKDTKC